MNQIARIEDAPGEVERYEAISLTEPMAVGLARAEIDVQIATARKFPRSISRSSENILTLVTMDEETAGECLYALPRGKKPIKGPSIRLAEIIFQCWGNARCDARVIHVDRVEKVVVAEGIYHDLETNSAGRATVRRRIVGQNGRIYNDDMITVTGNAACSIAKRNAILAGVPKSVWNRAYKAAEGVVAGDVKTLTESRDKAIKAFANFGVKPEQIYPVLGVDGMDDIGLDHIPILRGMFSALKNGEATVEEMFDARKAPSTHEKVVDPLSDAPEHDAESGEVGDAKDDSGTDAAQVEASSSSKGEGEAKPAKTKASDDDGEDGKGGNAKADAKPEDPAKFALLKKLRPKAEQGNDKLRRALGGLTEEEDALLNEADHEELGRIAEDADKGKGAA